jgi:Helix-turn-helix domain
MLVELGLVEERYQAVLEVVNYGASVTDVARRYGVARQMVHVWLRSYATEGLGGLADRRPSRCRARTRCHRRSRPGSCSCAASIPAGAPAGRAHAWPIEPTTPPTVPAAGPVTTRRVSAKGTISSAMVTYKAGTWLARQTVEVVCDGGLVQLSHRGVLVATHARRHQRDKQAAGMARGRQVRRSPSAVTAASVTRKVDASGNVCFAGTNHPVGRAYRRGQVQVAVVGDTVEISVGSSSSAPTAPATTAPASTAPWPTPAADPTASTPPDRFTCRPTTGATMSGGYRVLTSGALVKA